MTDATIALASGILIERGRLDAIRYLRRGGMPFAVANKYVAEIAQGAPWMKRAAKRARK
jgi:hypothetical protein